jgi:hypothetical protein
MFKCVIKRVDGNDVPGEKCFTNELDYSYRRAWVGAIWVARRAGT